MKSVFAIVTVLEDAEGARPDQGLPGGGGGHPWLPGHLGGPRPDAGLPGGGAHPWLPGRLGGPRPDAGLPIPPVYPSAGLPKPPAGGHPWLPGAIGGGIEGPVQLPVYPPEGANLPATDLRFVLRWLACVGWVLVPEGTPEPDPK